MRAVLYLLLFASASAFAGERGIGPLAYKNFAKRLPPEFEFEYTKDYREDAKVTHRHFWGGRASKLNMAVTSDSHEHVIAVEYYFTLESAGVNADDLRRMRLLTAILCPRWTERDNALDELLVAVSRDRGSYPDNLYRFQRESKNGSFSLQPDSSSPAINLTISVPDANK